MLCLTRFCKLHEDGLGKCLPLPCEDFNGLDHPRQLEIDNHSKVATKRIRKALFQELKDAYLMQ